MSRLVRKSTWALLLAASLSCQTRTRAKVITASPWWLTARFQPTATDIQGLPLRQIDSSWTGALVLSPAVMPPEAAGYLAQPAASSARFELNGDFNGDGSADRVLVGVYRNADTVGRFMLVLARRGDKWERADLLTMPSEAGFSVLTQRADTIHWWMCMECDDGFIIKWDGHHYSPIPADTVQ